MPETHEGTGFFGGFKRRQVQVDGGALNLRTGGSGPPLLLLHGNPQTHAIWHAVAPRLAARFTVICADLRGYGASFKPGPSADHAAYSKRAMASDMAQLMHRLGHEQFAVAGHDRGGRVAHRLALDNPHRVRRLAVLDIVPTLEHFERADMDFALGYYHWFWLAQPRPMPERMINNAPEEWFHWHASREPKGKDFFHPRALADYLAAVRKPEVVTAICEDYRAAASVDLDHDRATRAQGNRLMCPLLVLWGARGKIGEWYAPLEVWARYSTTPPEGGPVDSGHYLAEEAPGDVADRLLAFFS